MAAAAGAARVLGAVPVAACFDALRGQVYGAVYVVDADVVETLVPPLVLTIDELAARSPQRPRVVVGDGAIRYADQVMRWSGAAPVPIEALVPPAVSLLALLRRDGAATITDPATAEPVYGRPAAAPDLPAIHAIEEVAFSDPWSVKDFRECLAAGVPFLVAVAGGDVAGYAIAHVAADEGEILNLGVAAARGLYLELGFREVGRRSRYYRQPVEDAILLRAAISAETGDA